LTPLELERHVRGLREALDKLSKGKYSYREAHDHVRTDRRDPVRSDENQGIRISNSHVSDPTAEIVESQAWNRERLVQVSSLIESAEADVNTALARLREVFSSPDDYFKPLEGYRS
jgi:hypothetical protein